MQAEKERVWENTFMWNLEASPAFHSKYLEALKEESSELDLNLPDIPNLLHKRFVLAHDGICLFTEEEAEKMRMPILDLWSVLGMYLISPNSDLWMKAVAGGKEDMWMYCEFLLRKKGVSLTRPYVYMLGEHCDSLDVVEYVYCLENKEIDTELLLRQEMRETYHELVRLGRNIPLPQGIQEYRTLKPETLNVLKGRRDLPLDIHSLAIAPLVFPKEAILSFLNSVQYVVPEVTSYNSMVFITSAILSGESWILRTVIDEASKVDSMRVHGHLLRQLCVAVRARKKEILDFIWERTTQEEKETILKLCSKMGYYEYILEHKEDVPSELQEILIGLAAWNREYSCADNLRKIFPDVNFTGLSFNKIRFREQELRTPSIHGAFLLHEVERGISDWQLGGSNFHLYMCSRKLLDLRTVESRLYILGLCRVEDMDIHLDIILRSLNPDVSFLNYLAQDAKLFGCTRVHRFLLDLLAEKSRNSRSGK